MQQPEGLILQSLPQLFGRYECWASDKRLQLTSERKRVFCVTALALPSCLSQAGINQV